MIRALKMMIRDEALALKLTSDLQQRLFHVLQAEHLDVGFMLSGFRRRHKVSQRPVCVLGRLPRRDVVCQRWEQRRWPKHREGDPA